MGDGDTLTDLMLCSNVGIRMIDTYEIDTKLKKVVRFWYAHKIKAPESPRR